LHGKEKILESWGADSTDSLAADEETKQNKKSIIHVIEHSNTHLFGLCPTKRPEILCLDSL
jgi:hypothetical protein